MTIEITGKLYPGGVDYEGTNPERPRPRIRAGVENGKLWVNEMHNGTIEEAKALAECIDRSIKYMEAQQ